MFTILRKQMVDVHDFAVTAEDILSFAMIVCSKVSIEYLIL